MRHDIMKLLLVVLLVCSIPAAGAEDRAAEMYREARTLIENNCGDCRGGTRPGLESGIDSLQQAIALGVQDRAGAYRLLAEAYNTLALVYAEPDSAEQKEVVGKQADVYERLIDIDPRDAKVRFDYATLLQDPERRLEQVRQAVALAPDFAEARFVLAATLIETGNWQAGVEEGRDAIARATPDNVERYGRRIGELLDLAGRSEEAKLIRSEVRRRAGGSVQ